MKRRFARANTVLVFACLLGRTWSLPAAAQVAPPASTPAPNNPLDAFMAKVLEKREINRQTLECILDEVEQVEVLGPSRMPVYRQLVTRGTSATACTCAAPSASTV